MCGQIDADASGTIEFSELKAALKRLGFERAEHQAVVSKLRSRFAELQKVAMREQRLLIGLEEAHAKADKESQQAAAQAAAEAETAAQVAEEEAKAKASDAAAKAAEEQRNFEARVAAKRNGTAARDGIATRDGTATRKKAENRAGGG